MRSNDIYIRRGTSGTSERLQRVRRSNVPPERFAQTVLADVPGKPSLFKTEVVTERSIKRESSVEKPDKGADSITLPVFAFPPALTPVMEFTFFTFPQFFPLFPEPFIPKMALVAKKHHFGIHTKHRVIERIGFRSNFSLFVSCLAFVSLGFLCPATTLPVRDSVKEVRNDRQGMFRRLLANIYVLGRYTRQTTKN